MNRIMLPPGGDCEVEVIKTPEPGNTDPIAKLMQGREAILILGLSQKVASNKKITRRTYRILEECRQIVRGASRRLGGSGLGPQVRCLVYTTTRVSVRRPPALRLTLGPHSVHAKVAGGPISKQRIFTLASS